MSATIPQDQMVQGFRKSYTDPATARTAALRSRLARSAGVATPAVLGQAGSTTLIFEQITATAPATLQDVVQVVTPLHHMPPDGLSRFDPFDRIRPRLSDTSPRLGSLAGNLSERDAALRWPAGSVIHGDLHPGQVLKGEHGRLWLVDLDDLALAPPEADFGNLAAWAATRTEGDLKDQAGASIDQVLRACPTADAALTRHFAAIALLRRALKLAGRGETWVIDQLPLRA